VLASSPLLWEALPVAQKPIDTAGLPQDIEPYQELARASTQADFAKRVGTAMLLFGKSVMWDPSLLKRRAILGKELSRGTRVAKMDEITVTEDGISFLSPLRKRAGTKDAGISLGRGTTNDIVVPIASVSNTHCAFNVPGSKDPTHWTITDLGSSNGTYANHVLLQAYQDFPVDDGQHIRLGKHVVVWFLSPGRLWTLLRDDRLLSEHTDV
jgi:hypothetical protein